MSEPSSRSMDEAPDIAWVIRHEGIGLSSKEWLVMAQRHIARALDAARTKQCEQDEIAIHQCPALTSSAKVIAAAAIRNENIEKSEERTPHQTEAGPRVNGADPQISPRKESTMDDVVSALAHVMHMDNLTNYQKDVVDHAREEIRRLQYAGMDDADANQALDVCRAETVEEIARWIEGASQWPYPNPTALADHIRALTKADILAGRHGVGSTDRP